MAKTDRFSSLVEFFRRTPAARPGTQAYEADLCRILTRAASAEAASIWRIHADRKLCLTYGTNVDAASVAPFCLEPGEGISGAAVLSRKTVVVDQVLSSPVHSRKLDDMIGFKTRTMISAPLMADDTVFGVINLLNHKTHQAFPGLWKERLSLVGVLYARELAAAPVPGGRTRPTGPDHPCRKKSGNTGMEQTAVVGISPGIQHALNLALKAGSTRIPVLISGETGTGKELLARRIHEAVPDPGCPFIAVNCAAVTETIMESELFGHVKGAFSGAVDHRKGKFLAASGGILFLDEIGDMSLACQSKILRAIQEHRIVPVGSENEISCDVRIVAATNKDLLSMVRCGTFRDDLYYRLAGLEISLPPLRTRPEDIGILAAYFLERSRATQFSREALTLLERYHWPGNVRQLEQAVHAAAAVCEGNTVTPGDFPAWFHAALNHSAPGVYSPKPAPLISDTSRSQEAFHETAPEKIRYLDALRKTGYPGTGRWNIAAAARYLCLPRKTLVYRLKKLGLTRPAD